MAKRMTLAIWSFVFVPLGIVCGRIFGVVSVHHRKPLACAGQKNCVDLRGLDNIWIAFLILLIVAIVGGSFAYVAMQRNQKYAKAALVFNLVFAAIFFVATIVALVRR